MASAALRIHHYRGCYAQTLRNLTLLVPSIIWVRSGMKQLRYQHQSVAIQENRVLLASARDKLTFINIPESQSFVSTQFCLLASPEQKMLELSQKVNSPDLPYLELTPPLQHTLAVLANIPMESFTPPTQKYWLYALYQQLAEAGKLHTLFPKAPDSLTRQITEYLQRKPAQDHRIAHICHDFNLSKSTLIRHLKAEGTAFREILLNVRLNYALALMQDGTTNQLEIALACGYQSQERFSQQFSKHFGLSPRQYLKTLTI